MKIVVTGGLGLIGHNIVSRLEKMGHDVLIIDTMTNYGIIPQSEIDYLVEERMKKNVEQAIDELFFDGSVIRISNTKKSYKEDYRRLFTGT